jgi:hypothetical protein
MIKCRGPSQTLPGVGCIIQRGRLLHLLSFPAPVADQRQASYAAFTEQGLRWISARQLGLLEGENGRIDGRVQRDLVAAAKEKSGITSDTALLECALVKVALEDDYVTKLARRKGEIAKTPRS